MYEAKPPSGRRSWGLDNLFGRGEADGAPAPVAGTAVSAAFAGEAESSDFFARIGGFLRINRLDPTPVNYDVAYRFLGGLDPALSAAVETAIAQDGILRAEIAEEIAASTTNQVSSELVEKLIDQAHQSMTLATNLVGQSRSDVKAYGSALEKGAAALDAGPEPAARALELMVDLTRTMISKAHEAELKLVQMGEQMSNLQCDLAEAQATAESDPLTGLANRRAFQTRLDKAMQDAAAGDYPLTLAFCDIDHFKKINDGFGHDTGDRILKTIADALSEGAGDDTFVGRFGGEEFLILFDGIMARRAAMRVDEIREELSGRHFVSKTTGEAMGRVTFSAGVAQLASGEDAGDVLRRADEALYAAKNGGRNRVVIHGED